MTKNDDVKDVMAVTDEMGPIALDQAIADLESLGIVKTERASLPDMRSGEKDYEFWLVGRGRIAITEKAPIGFCGIDL